MNDNSSNKSVTIEMPKRWPFTCIPSKVKSQPQTSSQTPSVTEYDLQSSSKKNYRVKFTFPVSQSESIKAEILSPRLNPQYPKITNEGSIKLEPLTGKKLPATEVLAQTFTILDDYEKWEKERLSL